MMVIRSSLLVLLGAVLLGACSGKAKVREPAELKKIEAPAIKAKKVWSRSAGKGTDDRFAGLRVVPAPDAVFTADVNGKVFALDPANGKPIWTAETGTRLISGPSLSGAAAFIGTLDAEVVALARADGAELWRATLSSEVLAPPVSDGNVVVARTVDGRIYGLSAVDGEQLWVVDRSVPSLTLRGLAEPVLFAGAAMIGMDNGRILAIRLEDGQPIWEQVVAVPAGRTELERITDVDGDLLVSPNGVYAVSFGGELAAVRTESGEVQWRRSIRSYTGVTPFDGLALVSDEAGVVWALDAETGAAAWKQEDLQYRQLSQPVRFGEYVVVADFEGYLHWLAPRDGRIVGRTRIARDSLVTAPIAYEGRLYSLAGNGKLSVVEAKPAS